MKKVYIYPIVEMDKLSLKDIITFSSIDTGEGLTAYWDSQNHDGQLENSN